MIVLVSGLIDWACSVDLVGVWWKFCWVVSVKLFSGWIVWSVVLVIGLV